MQIIRFAAFFVFTATSIIAAAQTAATTTVVAVVEPIRPLPEKIDLDQHKVTLGEKLFSDARLSRTNRISCISCHDIANGGADTRALSLGVDEHATRYNTPTVLNSVFNFRQQWNGSARSLEEQINQHVKDTTIFDTEWHAIISKLTSDPALRSGFKEIYADGITVPNIVDALVTFEQSLITPSRFDRYLRGNDTAITPGEKLGYAKFKSYGCAACHQGVNIGGNLFQRLDAGRTLPAPPRPGRDGNTRRYPLTTNENDKQRLKVPGLRNVAMTAPYFHDGSVPTLEQAVDLMFTNQLGRTAPEGDRALIVKFLQSLNGTPPQGGKP